MKKTDVTQPVAMATPFAEGVYSATSTEDFEIPAATSTTADDSCVMDDGFLPITSTALDDGGKAPERKNFNGMFYLSTDQRFFLQNGGFITYNPDVATAIGGYPQDAILDFIDSNGNYKKVRSLIDDNSNNFIADETLIDGTNWEEIQMGGGASRNIGEIVASAVPLTDAGLHLFDGALIQGSGVYSAFVTRIAGLRTGYPNLFTTEALWQQAVTTYGVCGKFVYDSVNNTVRLPKTTGIVEGTTDLTALGDLVQAGLPNITGGSGEGSAAFNPNGAFYGIAGDTQYDRGSGTYCPYAQFGFDASRSNSIYGNSSTVQPQTIKVLYYIVIATSTKTEIEVDIDEIATDLNGKADVDLTNCTKPHIIERWSSGMAWYEKYSDGWIRQGSVTPQITGGNYFDVTFLLPMSGMDMSITITPIGSYTAQAEANDVVYSRYATGMRIYSGHIAPVYMVWKVEGQGA